MSIKCRDHLGNEFDSVRAMCKHWGVSVSTYSVRRSNGYSIEVSLTGDGISRDVTHLCHRCFDHCGNEFMSQKEMCKYWGVTEAVFAKRGSRGYSIEECLLGKRSDKKVIDHEGNLFVSIVDMCKHYGISVDTYRRRLNRGCSLEECLAPNENVYVDHLGNTFSDIDEMCNYWNVKKSTFRARKRAGYTIEQSLTGCGVKAAGWVTRQCVDHTGRCFDSLLEMCKYWGVDTGTFTTRMNAGYSLKESLETQKFSTSCVDIVEDHLGNRYASIREMCKIYNVPVKTYYWRVNNGWSLRDALCGRRERSVSIDAVNGFVDHRGNQYSSLEDMCRYWGVAIELFKKRFEYGYSLQASLTGEGVKDEFK